MTESEETRVPLDKREGCVKGKLLLCGFLNRRVCQRG